MTNQTDRLELLRRHLAAENAHDLAGTLATLSQDCVFHDTTLGRVYQGRDGAAAYYRLWWHAFDVQVSSEELHWTTGGGAIAETRFRGRHVGEFLGVPATGRQVEVPIAIFVDFRDGLMGGERFSWDRATLLDQLVADRLPQLG